MGGWGIIGMSGWVGQEGYGCLWVSACQYLRLCLPGVYKLSHPDTYAFEGSVWLSGNQPHIWLCLCPGSPGLQCDLRVGCSFNHCVSKIVS